MFDYISAIYYGESFGGHRPSPLDKPKDAAERALVQQMNQVAEQMGHDFSQKMRRDLQVVLSGCCLEAFQNGVHIGGQLTASILLDPQ